MLLFSPIVPANFPNTNTSQDAVLKSLQLTLFAALAVHDRKSNNT